MPSHGTLEESFIELVAVLSLNVKRLSSHERKIAPSNRNIFTYVVVRALNAVSGRNKTET